MITQTIFPRNEARVLLSLAPFFGWLLSFPLNGPVLHLLASDAYPSAGELALWFIGFHAAGLLAGALCIKQESHWHTLMLGSLVLTISLHLLLGGLDQRAWPYVMSLLGVSSALFILGWSYPYTHWLQPHRRLRFMAAVIILANLIYLLVNILAHTLTPALVSTLSLLVLLPVLPAVLGMKARAATSAPEDFSLALPPLPPWVLMAGISLLFFGFYLNGGLIYTVVFATFADSVHLSPYLRLILYILVLLAIWGLDTRIPRPLLVYLSASLLGLAFITFALLVGTQAGYFMAEALFQAAFAMLDLFSWVILGDIAAFYRGRPAAHQIFGYGLAAMVGAIFVGQVVGQRLLQAGEPDDMVTALLAVAVIFITYLIVPWLNQRLEGWFSPAERVRMPQLPMGAPEQLVAGLQVSEPLTAREKEISALILQGYSNKEVASLLQISPNTLKTHIKHLYRKAGAAQKRELIALATKLKQH